MALSDANFGAIRYKLESSWGETPGGSTLIEAPITGESLRGAKATVRSDVLRSDRMRGANLEVGFSVEGGLNVELAYGAYDVILGAMMASDFVTASISASVVFGSSTITLTSTQADSIPVGAWIKTTATGISANNGIFRVVSKAGAVLTLNTDALSSTTASAIVQCRTIKNGTTKKSLFMEKYLTDVDDLFQYTGMRVNTMSFEVQAGDKVTGSFDMMGKSEAYASATVASAITSATSNDVMNATSNVGFIYEGGYTTELSTAIMGLNFTATNNLRTQSQVGSKYPAGIGYGSFEASGQVNAYFEDAALYTKFVNHTATSLSFRFTDADGNIMIFTFPRVKYTNAPVNIQGINTDVMIPLDWEAEPDSATNCIMQIDCLPATGAIT